MKKACYLPIFAAFIIVVLAIPFNASCQTITSPRAGGVMLLVSDNMGNPLAGTTVSTVVAGRTVSQLTNLRGQATFGSLPPGLYTVTVSKQGYLPQGPIPPFTVTAGIVSTGKCIMIKLGSARVKVSYAGTPVAGANVSVSINRRQVAMTTDPGGAAVFGNVLPGSYVFAAEKVNYTSGRATANVLSGQETAVALELTRTGALEVTVKDGEMPLEKAVVNASVNSVAQTAVTNSQGVALFSNISAGTSLIFVKKDGYVYSDKQIMSSSILVNQTARVVYPMKKPTGSLEVTATGGNIPPYSVLPGATVSLTGQNLARTIITDSQGKALFSGLPFGDYTFKVKKDGYQDQASTGVKIATADIWRVRPNLMITPRISFTIVESNQIPVSGATVTLTGTLGGVQSLVTDAQGIVKFANNLMYDVTYNYSVAKAGYDGFHGTCSILKQVPETKMQVPVAKFSALEVTVTDGVNPLSGALVEIGSGQQTYTTDVQGRATFNNLYPGAKTVSAKKAGYPTDQKSITLAAGEVKSLALVLPRYRVVSISSTPSSVRLGQGSRPALSVTIDRPAGTGGASVFLASSEPQLVTVPASIGVPAGASSATSSITIQPATASNNPTSPRQVTISAGSGTDAVSAGIQANTTMTVSPIMLKKLVPISSVPVQPLYAGTDMDKGFGYVEIDSPSSLPLLVSLTSAEPDVVNFSGALESNPTSYPVQINAGTTQANIRVAAISPALRKTSIGEDRDVAVTAEFLGQRITATVPVLWPRAITSLVISPPNQYSASTATVTLDRPAPANGVQLSINSSNRAAFYSLPYSVNVGGGRTSATFALSLKGPAYSGTTVTVTAVPYWNTSATATVPLQ